MKAITNFIVSVLLLVSALSVHAQGTAFSYQGRLNSGTNPANGTYDLTFALFNVVSGAGQVGATLTNSTIAVSNGLFTVFLDFGANFPGANRWLEIGARTNGIGTFTTLAPRQKITPTPYAITASNLTGVLPATQLTGTLPSAQLAGTYGTALSFNNAANVFAGNGSGLINLNPTSILWGSCPPWSICGNAGTTAGVNFLGTTDNQPLELKSFGQRALRLEATGGAPNVIGGRSNNFVAAGEAGGAIGGGEANGISSSWGTVAGGIGNTVGSSSAYSSIGGGRTNRIFNSGGAVHSTIGGGHNNTIGDSHGTIGGGADNYISFGTMVTIAGGWGNQVGGVLKADSAAIGGGEHNIINAVWCGTIAGGLSNVVGGAIFGAIGGGKNNFVGSDSGTIAGGENNLVPNNSSFSGIGGGRNNRVSATDATIAGGNGNSITNAPFADGCALGSTIGGGLQNSIIAYCTPYWGGSTIGGGYSNIIRAANSCTVGGGRKTTSLARPLFTPLSAVDFRTLSVMVPAVPLLEGEKKIL